MQHKTNDIEEMAKMVCSSFNGSCYICPFDFYPPCPPKKGAERLYNAGYRKAEDVAMEIFGEIEKLLRENQFTLIPPYRSEITDWKTVFRLKLAGDIAELKKKYTTKSEGEE